VKGEKTPSGTAPLDLDEALAGLADAVGSLATFVAADRVSLGRVSPADLRAALARRLPLA
jgi:hypothetical protein